MWLKAQNEMAGLWPHAAMGPVERMVRPHRAKETISSYIAREATRAWFHELLPLRLRPQFMQERLNSLVLRRWPVLLK